MSIWKRAPPCYVSYNCSVHLTFTIYLTIHNFEVYINNLHILFILRTIEGEMKAIYFICICFQCIIHSIEIVKPFFQGMYPGTWGLLLHQSCCRRWHSDGHPYQNYLGHATLTFLTVDFCSLLFRVEVYGINQLRRIAIGISSNRYLCLFTR